MKIGCSSTCWKQLIDCQAWGWRMWIWSYYCLPWYSFALTFVKWEWKSTLCLWRDICNKHFVTISHSQRDFPSLSMIVPIIYLLKPKHWSEQCFIWDLGFSQWERRKMLATSNYMYQCAHHNWNFGHQFRVCHWIGTPKTSMLMSLLALHFNSCGHMVLLRNSKLIKLMMNY
jgi:hypothetical protein